MWWNLGWKLMTNIRQLSYFSHYQLRITTWWPLLSTRNALIVLMWLYYYTFVSTSNQTKFKWVSLTRRYYMKGTFFWVMLHHLSLIVMQRNSKICKWVILMSMIWWNFIREIYWNLFLVAGWLFASIIYLGNNDEFSSRPKNTK